MSRVRVPDGALEGISSEVNNPVPVLFFVLHWIKLVPGILFPDQGFPDQACFLQLFLTVVSYGCFLRLFLTGHISPAPSDFFIIILFFSVFLLFLLFFRLLTLLFFSSFPEFESFVGHQGIYPLYFQDGFVIKL